jgi:hypothetical protein
MTKKNEGLEVSSAQLHSDLTEIKERIAALETIASLANQTVVEKYVKGCLTTDTVKKIVSACEQPKTKEQLREVVNLSSIQALDHHLKQIREFDLLQQEIDNGKLTFRWSNLFARLPKRTRDQLLNIGNTSTVKVVKKVKGG